MVLRAMGHTVTGSDLRELAGGRTASVPGHLGRHRSPRRERGEADAVTYSPAVQPGNAELVEAAAKGSRSCLVRSCWPPSAATRRCLAVAGTHGKTTTASMLSLILVEAGLHPSFLIGADVNEIGTNAVWDTGDWLVVEADESFGTFRAILPDVAVLTNVGARSPRLLRHLRRPAHRLLRVRRRGDEREPWSVRTTPRLPPWPGRMVPSRSAPLVAPPTS